MAKRQSSQRQTTRRTTRKRQRTRARTPTISLKKRYELALKGPTQEELDELASKGI
jgi:hypothetical protein